MRLLFTLGLAFGLAGVSYADDKKADPVGSWKLEYDIGGQKREATLTVKKDGDKLSGKMVWQDKQEAKLQDVKLKDNELTFSAEREFMDNKFLIKYKLKLDGDKIKGTGEADFDGQTQSFDIEGKREKKDK
ncbi:MAG: hypothetical protein U0871_29280 [Gemmataceae bacterium]